MIMSTFQINQIKKKSIYILIFVFILPAWIIFIFSCLVDIPVFKRLLPVNRKDKNWVTKETKYVWKQMSKQEAN